MKKNIDEFMNEYNINFSFRDFFKNRVDQIDEFINNLIINGEKFAPERKNIFKAFTTPVEEINVVILGKDPYFQEGAATGLAFEVNGLNSWNRKIEQRSLLNILRKLYEVYSDELLKPNEVKAKIESGEFEILSPDELLKSWQKQGVFLINSFLTVKIDNGKNTSGSHEKFWSDFSKDLITFISIKNRKISYFLWGAHAKLYKNNVVYGKVYDSNHPAMAFGKNKNDFLFFDGFIKSKNIIEWRG